MKTPVPRLAFALLAPLLAAVAARSQTLTFDLQPRHGAYIVGEPVSVTVRIDNRGPRSVVIGDNEAFRDNRLVFEIGTDPLEPLSPRRQERIIDDLDLANGESFSRELDLSSWYPLLKPGRYFATAVLYVNDRRYDSPRRMFDVVPGIELTSLVVPIPGQTVGQRRFSVVYWVRNDKECSFLRMSDQPDGTVWTTLQLGSIVRLNPPALSVDADGRVRLRHQATRDVYVNSVIDSPASGPVLLSQAQEFDTTTTPLVHALTEAARRDAAREGEAKANEQPRNPAADKPATLVPPAPVTAPHAPGSVPGSSKTN